jgi:hypothetical protein
MSEKYLIKTKNSWYPIEVKGGHHMKITTPQGDAVVERLSEKSTVGEAAQDERGGVKVGHLVPERHVVFKLGNQMGMTSKIEEVYQQIH